MHDLDTPLTYVPVLIDAAEVIAAIILGRMRIRLAFWWVLGSYLASVVVALGFAIVVHDELGFSSIPLIALAQPWMFFLPRYPDYGYQVGASLQNIWGIAFTIAINCLVFYIIGRLSYPKLTTHLPGQNAT